MNIERVYFTQWLLSCYELSNGAQHKILEKSAQPEEIFQMSLAQWEVVLPSKYAQVIWNKCQEIQKSGQAPMEYLKAQYEELSQRGIGFVAFGEKDYPVRLRDIPDPPLGLYYKGQLPQPNAISVAIIGSRDCSEYGRHVAKTLGRFLGERDVAVISGMARGVDGISQQAALQAGGLSYGVLGCGVDICYPQSNRGLYQTLTRQGGILSSYPPGTPPVAGNFPPRNRIVSGLANAVVVVEAAMKSGTSITVSMALEQGREVYVVPGRVTDRLSDGCNQLIKQGANVFTDPESFFEELQESFFLQTISPMQKGSDRSLQFDSQVPADLREDLQTIWKALDRTPKTLEEIQKSLQEPITIQDCTIKLMELVLSGKAKQVSSGHFCKA